MAEFTLGTGSRVLWMERELTSGAMVSPTKAHLARIKSRGSAYSGGLIDDATGDTGNRGSRTVLQSTCFGKTESKSQSMEDGLTGSAKSGLKSIQVAVWKSN